MEKATRSAKSPKARGGSPFDLFGPFGPRLGSSLPSTRRPWLSPSAEALSSRPAVYPAESKLQRRSETRSAAPSRRPRSRGSVNHGRSVPGSSSVVTSHLCEPRRAVIRRIPTNPAESSATSAKVDASAPQAENFAAKASPRAATGPVSAALPEVSQEADSRRRRSKGRDRRKRVAGLLLRGGLDLGGALDPSSEAGRRHVRRRHVKT